MDDSEFLYNDEGPRVFCPFALQVARIDGRTCVGCQFERLGGKPVVDKNREVVKKCTGIIGKKQK